MALKTERLASGQIYRLYDDTTFETVHVFAPIYEYWEFGRCTSATAIGDGWVERETVGAVTCPDAAANIARCLLTSASSDQEAAIAHNNVRRYDLGAAGAGNYFGMEVRCALTTADMSGCLAFIGMMGDTWTLASQTIHNVDVHVGFQVGLTALSGNDTSIYCIADDTATDSETDSGLDWTTTEYHILRFQCNSGMTDVNFYVDGSAYAASTAFSLATLTAAEAMMQPYIGVYKQTTEGDGALAQLDIDYVRLWGIR